MAWLFVFFFVSGFCSILYELIWLRLAMADFGVTTPMMSTVLSMFMAGLGLGSWASGRLARRWRGNFPALRWYALAELLIGVSAVAVPFEMSLGRDLLRGLGSSSSFIYYIFSGGWVALTLIPWCACMGLTIPLAMLAVRSSYKLEARSSFSYLYLANVLGAGAGTTVPLLLIEIFGFHRTLTIGAMLNVLLAAGAFAVTLRGPFAMRSVAEDVGTEPSQEVSAGADVVARDKGVTPAPRRRTQAGRPGHRRRRPRPACRRSASGGPSPCPRPAGA